MLYIVRRTYFDPIVTVGSEVSKLHIIQLYHINPLLSSLYSSARKTRLTRKIVRAISTKWLSKMARFLTLTLKG